MIAFVNIDTTFTVENCSTEYEAIRKVVSLLQESTTEELYNLVWNIEFEE